MRHGTSSAKKRDHSTAHGSRLVRTAAEIAPAVGRRDESVTKLVEHVWHVESRAIWGVAEHGAWVGDGQA
jgi:hypothetical protein